MGFVEVKAPEQFKFEKPGDSIVGVLLSMTPQKIKEKTALQYTVQRDDGSKATFLATWDLAQKIDKSMLGCPLSVKFSKVDANLGKQGNPAKVFVVMVNRDAKQIVETPIPEFVDEDIPF